MGDDVLYASRIFLNAALPLVKVLAEEKGGLKKAFAGKNGIVQVSARNSIAASADEPEKVGTHFVVTDGVVKVVPGLAEKPDVELAFPSVEALNGFFSGKSKKLPRIFGAFGNFGLFLAFFKTLLAMAAALGAKEPPKESKERALLVKLFFYLLTSGISQLNKAGHPDVSKWAKRSPDRVYALAVLGEDDLAAYIRVKAGNSKAVRGVYERSKPFFTLAFDSVDSALGTLLGKDEMIAATAAGRIRMLGAPEYGAMLGEFLLLVGSLAK
jgi:hypothetical protein